MGAGARMMGKPRAGLVTCCSGIASVSADILPCDVGENALVSESLSIENRANLMTGPSGAKPVCSEKQTKFERHVEPRETVIELHVGDVMDAEMAGANQGADFLETDLSGVVEFQRATRRETTGEDGEHDGVECVAPIRREGRVYED